MDAEFSPGETQRLLTRIDEELTEHRTETRTELRGIRAELRDLATQTSAHAVAIAGHEARHRASDIELRDLKRKGAPLAEAAATTGDVQELIEIARDLKGITKFGKMVWGLLIASGPVLLAWWMWLKAGKGGA